MRILCIGLSYKTADISVRERLTFDAARARRGLADLAKRWPDAEFLLLSTCNRTEIYLARPVHGHPREQELTDWLGEFCGVHHSVYAMSIYTRNDSDAAANLFAVTAGLESLVPGEDQIVAQVKNAYALAVEAGTARTMMNDLVQTALHVAKHVRSETGMAQGKVSVASVAIDCVARAFASLADKTVLNIGAGKMNALMLRHLIDLKADRILVTNRSAAKAKTLAADCGGTALPFKNLLDHLAQADVVLTSTASSRPIITADHIKAVQRRRKYRPLLIVDIAVPRDVEVDASRVKGVRLYNIDDLDRIVQAGLQSRLENMDQARQTVQEHVLELMNSLNVRTVAPTIDALYNRLRKIADEELATAIRKLSTHDDAEADQAIMQAVLHRTIRRILHPAAHHLRNSAGTDAARAHVSAIRKLFELGE